MKTLKLILVVQFLVILLLCLFRIGFPLPGKNTGDFEKGTEGWGVLDKSVASVSQVRDPTQIHDGKGSLRFDYEFKKGKLPVCGTKNLNMKGKKAIKFWVKSKDASALAVVIREKNNSNFVYPVALGQGDTWKEVAFNFSDMKPEKNSDHKAPDTRGAVLGIVDFLTVMMKQEGKKTIWIDNVRLLDAELPASETTSAQQSAFEQGTGQWVPLCPDKSSLAVSRESSGKGILEFAYTLEQGSIIALAGLGMDFKNSKGMSFWVKTEEPSECVLALEKKNKARYIYTFSTSSSKWQKVDVSLDQFSLAPDSTDPENRFDREELNGILFLADMDNFYALKTGPQKLWLKEFTLN
jgi:hypothetical protein